MSDSIAFLVLLVIANIAAGFMVTSMAFNLRFHHSNGKLGFRPPLSPSSCSSMPRLAINHHWNGRFGGRPYDILGGPLARNHHFGSNGFGPAFGNQYQSKISIKPVESLKHPPIDLNINYYDNLPAINGRPLKTVFTAHGSPGVARNLSRHFRTMTENNMRVILPEFPKFDVMKSTNIRLQDTYHTRSLMASAILNNLKVDSIDCAIGHSSGTLISAMIWDQPSVDVKSLALLHPVSWRSPKLCRPQVVSDITVALSKTPARRAFFDFIRRPMTLMVGNLPFTFLSADNCYEGSYFFYCLNQAVVKDVYQRIVMNNVPRLMVSSTDDPFLGDDYCRHVLSTLSTSNSQRITDDKGCVVDKWSANDVKYVRWSRSRRSAWIRKWSRKHYPQHR